MEIKTSRNTFETQISHCNGSDPTIAFNTECTVPLSVLTAAPFSLVLGQTISLQVTAININGNSPPSPVGGTALIDLVPDAPLNLANNPSVTLATQIGLTWSDGVSNGGTVV